ncbi:hypothetical protein BGZ73_004084 [Actinomortierella ambigua]|nr:hypothetical protein BGZ73_004084 [Actinomortierella ambigua]
MAESSSYARRTPQSFRYEHDRQERNPQRPSPRAQAFGSESPEPRRSQREWAAEIRAGKRRVGETSPSSSDVKRQRQIGLSPPIMTPSTAATLTATANGSTEKPKRPRGRIGALTWGTERGDWLIERLQDPAVFQVLQGTSRPLQSRKSMYIRLAKEFNKKRFLRPLKHSPLQTCSCSSRASSASDHAVGGVFKIKSTRLSDVLSKLKTAFIVAHASRTSMAVSLTDSHSGTTSKNPRPLPYDYYKKLFRNWKDYWINSHGNANNSHGHDNVISTNTSGERSMVDAMPSPRPNNEAVTNGDVDEDEDDEDEDDENNSDDSYYGSDDDEDNDYHDEQATLASTRPCACSVNALYPEARQSSDTAVVAGPSTYLLNAEQAMQNHYQTQQPQADEEDDGRVNRSSRVRTLRKSTPSQEQPDSTTEDPVVNCAASSEPVAR